MESTDQKKKSFFDLALEGLAAFLLIAMVLLVSYESGARYTIGKVPSWIEEVARGCFIYLTFIGAGLAVRKAANLKVDFLLMLLPEKIRQLAEMVLDFVNIAFLIVVTYYSLPLLVKVHLTPLPALQISTSYFYAAVTIGAGIMLISTVEKVRRTFAKWHTSAVRGKGEC